MRKIKITLPDGRKLFVDQQVSSRGVATSNEDVQQLVRNEQQRLQLRTRLLAGAGPPSAAPAEAGYFADLRDGISRRRSRAT